MGEGHYDEAIDLEHAAVGVSQALGAKSSAAKIFGNLGWSYYKTGDIENALALFTQAQRASAQLGIIKDEMVWLTNIAGMQYENKSYLEAEQAYQKALSTARKLENKSAAAVCLNNLALLSIETGRLDDAERYNSQSLNLKRSNEDHSAELYSLLTDGLIAVRRGELGNAESLFQKVIRDSGEDASLRWEAEANLADVYDKQGRPALADQQFRKSI